MSKRWIYLSTIFMLIVFMFITNFTTSVNRACIMGIVAISANLFFRKADFLTSISLSLLITLTINPFAITEVGFELSYLGTLGILLFNRNIEKILEIKLPSKIFKIISVTISAQIAIMPIMAYRFNNISLTFFISNFFAGLILGIIIIFGFITIFISFLSFKLAKIFAIYLNMFLEILNLISKLISKIPFSNITIVTPYLVSIILIYFFILIFNYIYNIYNSKKIQRRFEKKIIKKINKKNFYKFLAVIILFNILFVSFSFIQRKISKQLQINFVDVGQGDCTLIITPNNNKILIDGGEENNVLVPYLLDRRIKNIDYIIISHFDSDHVGRLIKSNG